MMMSILAEHWLEIVTTVLGLIYIWLEYRASIWLWVVGIVMPAMQVYLYWSHGLFAFAALTCYYTLAAVYGLAVWKFRKTRKTHQPLPIVYMPRRLYVSSGVAIMALWTATYYLLIRFTDSPVPTLESLTNAFSIVGLWALSRKFLEQWFFWIVANTLGCIIYIQTDMPYYVFLYGLYNVIAVAGYFKWKREARKLKGEA
jgi:nicotinamide mononucleotide transporter